MKKDWTRRLKSIFACDLVREIIYMTYFHCIFHKKKQYRSFSPMVSVVECFGCCWMLLNIVLQCMHCMVCC